MLHPLSLCQCHFSQQSMSFQQSMLKYVGSVVARNPRAVHSTRRTGMCVKTLGNVNLSAET